MHRRTLIASALATMTGLGVPSVAPADERTWLRIFPDRYELDGKTCTNRSELVAALKLTDKTKKIALNWTIPKTETDRARMAQRVEEAQGAAEESGLGRLPSVANEIF